MRLDLISGDLITELISAASHMEFCRGTSPW